MNSSAIYTKIIYPLFFFINLLLFGLGGHAQGTYYKWVDENGKIHLSNAPPGDAKEATPLEMRDHPEDNLSRRVRYIDEVGEKLTGLMSQARVLIQARSNSTANKTELRSIALQLEETLKEYESRGKLAIAAEAEPLYRKAIRGAVNTTRDGVRTYVSLIRKYVEAKEVLDEPDLNKLEGEKKLPGPKISEDVRIALRNSSGVFFNSWRPYKNPNELIQVGTSENEVETIAGSPDEKEFYTETRQGHFMAIAGWYYVNSTHTQTTLLEFEISTRSLIRITSRP